MKQLITILFLSWGIFNNCQDNPVLQVKLDSIVKVEESIIDYAHKIELEKSRRKVLIQKLKARIQTLEQAKIKSRYRSSKEGGTMALNDKAIKSEDFVVEVEDDRYKIELIPRKFTGRLFSRYDYRVRIQPLTSTE